MSKNRERSLSRLITCPRRHSTASINNVRLYFEEEQKKVGAAALDYMGIAESVSATAAEE